MASLQTRSPTPPADSTSDAAPADIRSTADAHTDAATRTPWPERLVKLARLATTATGIGPDNAKTAHSIHSHLDAIENMLHDPRPELTREVVNCRPDSGLRSQSVGSDTSIGSRGKEPSVPLASAQDHRNELVNDDGFKKDEILSQLTSLLDEVNTLNAQLEARRKESSEICDLYEERCRGSERAVAELELEVVELYVGDLCPSHVSFYSVSCLSCNLSLGLDGWMTLTCLVLFRKADLVEDAVELEGIQGTIHGLQAWVEGLQEADLISRSKRDLAHQKTRSRWGRIGSVSEHIASEADAEMLLEGLSAWMRGWKDVEEEYQVRTRARRTRREQRQAMFSQSQKDIPSQTVDRADSGLWSRAFPVETV